MPDSPSTQPAPASPERISQAQAAARAARAWAATVPTPEPSVVPEDRDLPANAWCTRPPTPEETAAAARRAEIRRAAEPDPVEVELTQYASHLVGTAWYADRQTLPEYGGVPAPRPDLSPEAQENAHGCRIGLVRVWKYFSRTAYACLDCHWVGEIVPFQHHGPGPDAAAAAAHRCPGVPQ